MREHLHRETFHKISYFEVFIWFVELTVLLSITILLLSKKDSDYGCDPENKALVHERLVHERCSNEFNQHYDERTFTSIRHGLIFYVPTQVIFLAVVFGAYSCGIKSKVQSIRTEIERNTGSTDGLEQPPERVLGNGICLIWFYLGQLVSRLVLRVVAIVLVSLYRHYFDKDLNFECTLRREGNLPASNITGEIRTYKCFIIPKKTEFYFILSYTVFNVFFALLPLIEILYILKLGACCSMKNKDFLTKYLRTIKEEDEDCPPQPVTGNNVRIPFINDRREETRLDRRKSVNYQEVLHDFDEEDEVDCPPQPVTGNNELIRFINNRREETRLDLRKSKEYQQGDEVAAVLLDLWINKEDKTGGYKLAVLDLGFTNITDQGAIYISDALKNDNCKLTQLYLDGNRIGSIGAKHLSDALTNENCTLTLLTLGEDITDNGVEVLKPALTHTNCKLTELRISGDKIGDNGALYLSSALTDANCKLTKLYLHGNKIGDKGAEPLAEVLKTQICNLEELTLIANQMGDTGVELMYRALEHENRNLKKLCLEGNKISREKMVQRIGKTTVSVGKCRRRDHRTPMEKRTKPMITKTDPDKTAKALTFSP